jgi:putative aminopeptidase FrvX
MMADNTAEIKRLLKLFIEATGASGFEAEIRTLIHEEITSYADESSTDSLGNLIFTKKGSNPELPALLIMGHMDEIGMMVRHIDAKGFIRFSYLGGFFDQIVLGQRVLVHGAKGVVPGVIGSKPPHLMTEEDRKKVVTRENMFIDIGATSNQEVKTLGIQIGDPITWIGPYLELQNELICGKALDNRVVLPIILEVFKSAKNKAPLICVASVREETGLQGARTSSYSLNLDHPLALGVSLDIALAGDSPLIKEDESPIFLGKGPTITIAQGRRNSLQDGYIITPAVKNFIIGLAEKNKIPYQLEIMEGGLTDATEIALTRGGIPTANLGIPTRYVHSPCEVASLGDIRHAIHLLTLIVENLPNKFETP